MNLRYILYFHCFPEHFTSISFYFVVYSIYTTVCTVVTHLFASVIYRDNRNIILFSHLDHAHDLHLLIRFQHKRMPVLSGWVSLIYTPVASLSGFVPPPS